MSTHYLGRELVLLQVARGTSAHELQAQAAAICRSEIHGRLEELFDELAGDDIVVYLDRMEVDLGTIHEEEFAGIFADKLLLELEKSIRVVLENQVPDAPDSQVRSQKVHQAENWLYFFEKGYFPDWNAEKASLDVPEDVMAIFCNNRLYQHRLVDLLSESLSAFLRWQRQWKEPQQARLWTSLTREAAAWTPLLDLLRQQISPKYFPTAFHALLSAFLFSATDPRRAASLLRSPLSFLDSAGQIHVVKALQFSLRQRNHDSVSATSAIQDILNDSKRPLKTMLSQDDPIKQADEEAWESHIYVPHAGLVLIHPYLPALFSQLGLLTDRSFSERQQQQRAVALLAWIASGDEHLPEASLPMIKLLCGLPLAAFAENPAPLTDLEKAECLDLLEAVIGHWAALKNTSPDGLREGFLQRPGTLRSLDRGWQLRLEPSPLDILLDRLPWGLSLVKLPWMPEMIHVTWI